MMSRSSWLALFSLVGCLGARSAGAAAPVDKLRVYVLDCGGIEAKDMAWFSDTGEYNGKPGKLADMCFLIRHPKGDFLWDTGLGDALAKKTAGFDDPMGFHEHVDHTLVSQLQALGLTPADIKWVSFSHFHEDHTGNAPLFTGATWIVNRHEVDWVNDKRNGHNNAWLTAHPKTKLQVIDLDHDVFGDGSVIILRTAGHTPGHQSLMIKLPDSGTLILSGDLYHTRANFEHGRVPSFNYNRADTQSSFDRIAKLIAATKARFVVQHAPEDFAALPKPPAFLH